MSEFHSVTLEEEKCEGCTSCVQNCPTKAIRVHQGQAQIKDKKCIDCGECIRSCTHHAKQATTDQLSAIADYKYPVVLLPPSFYGQFVDIDPRKVVLGLKNLGFKEVWDVALGAEALTKRTQEYLQNHQGPTLSSACPTIVRLIQVLYPELLKYLLPFKSPLNLVAKRAETRVKTEQELDEEEIGIFFITPCPAKMTTVKNPIGLEESSLDGAIAVDNIYRPLFKRIEKIDTVEIDNYELPYLGIGWANRGGESRLLAEDTISVSGIHNVISVLDELERGDLSHIKHFELLACEPGCVGGVLNVKNPFLAQFNIKQLIANQDKFIGQNFSVYDFSLDKEFEAQAVDPLDDDFALAISKLGELEEVKEKLPGLDCASCGAPNCETLAEDIVNGLAKETDCIFILRQQLANLSDEMASLAHALPPVMPNQKEADTDED